MRQWVNAVQVVLFSKLTTIAKNIPYPTWDEEYLQYKMHPDIWCSPRQMFKEESLYYKTRLILEIWL